MSAHAVDVGSEGFDEVVLEGSKTAPVIVDFWAPWCAPCRTLKPVLEKLAAEYGGKFTLVKVNSDENPELATRYGVRGIPNVKAFVDGEMVNEFSGAQPESAVRKFIDTVVPSAAEVLRRQAVAAGRNEAALALLTEALALEPLNEALLADRIELLLDLDRAAEASAALDTAPEFPDDPKRFATLKARAQFSPAGGSGVNADALRARIAANERDHDARLELANLNVAAKDYQAALDQLLEIVRRDRKFRDDAGRKTMLAVFDLLGGAHDLIGPYRRLLASALH